MSKILQRVETTLRCFYIFNSNFCKKEGEEANKILYYNPEDIELNTKIKDVGLSEAIIQFTGTFVGSNDCKALHTQKTTQLFYQPESGYWMVMVLNVPKEVKSKDGIEVPEYRGAEVQDRMYRAILRQCYNKYRLNYGTFHSNLSLNECDDYNGRQQLQEKLSTFLNDYLRSLKFPVNDILSFMHSIQYLPLEQSLFLRAHNFINMIRSTFPIIRESVLLYEDYVISGGQIEPMELCSLHQYIGDKFFEKSEGASRNAHIDSPIVEKYLNGVFVTGSEFSEQSVNLPRVYLKLSGELNCYYLIIFRVLNATLCLLKSADESPPSFDFYTELRTYMEPQLSSISKDIEESSGKQQSLRKANTSTSLSALTSSVADDCAAPKYIFINEKTLNMSLIFLKNVAKLANRSNIFPPMLLILLLISSLMTKTTISKNLIHH
ncbi:unnamed protein product [Ceratitis capitata]|uniref:(Mediterranean fruit fly) hypothetical protein n=1 Tax=Ceratitis capitata TaxID=7213 RepID=A0A811UUA8_CERCA|nr:unnamed protein product [Ceratitis capitata]